MYILFCADELRRSVWGTSVEMTSPGQPSACLTDIDIKTKIRVLRKNALRVCINPDAEDDDEVGTVRVYHSVQNSRCDVAINIFEFLDKVKVMTLDTQL